MSIPDTDLHTAEIIMNGLIDSGGAGTIVTSNVFHYRRITTLTPVDKADLITAFNTNVGSVIAGVLNQRWNGTTVTARMIEDATDPPFIVPTTPPGGVSGDSMTSIDTVYILMKTPLKGKNYRGNKHFGPLSESDTTTPDEDILNNAAVTAWQAVADALKAVWSDATTNSWQPCILSRKLSQTRINPTTVITTDVLQCLLNKRIGRLRKRERKSVY